MRILILSSYDFPAPEGLTARIRGFAKGLAAQGCEVTVLAPNLRFEQAPHEQHRDGYQIIRTSAASLPRYIPIVSKSYSSIMLASRFRNAIRGLPRFDDSRTSDLYDPSGSTPCGRPHHNRLG